MGSLRKVNVSPIEGIILKKVKLCQELFGCLRKESFPWPWKILSQSLDKYLWSCFKRDFGTEWVVFEISEWRFCDFWSKILQLTDQSFLFILMINLIFILASGCYLLPQILNPWYTIETILMNGQYKRGRQASYSVTFSKSFYFQVNLVSFYLLLI